MAGESIMCITTLMSGGKRFVGIENLRKAEDVALGHELTSDILFSQLNDMLALSEGELSVVKRRLSEAISEVENVRRERDELMSRVKELEGFPSKVEEIFRQMEEKDKHISELKDLNNELQEQLDRDRAGLQRALAAVRKERQEKKNREIRVDDFREPEESFALRMTMNDQERKINELQEKIEQSSKKHKKQTRKERLRHQQDVYIASAVSNRFTDTRKR